MKLELINRSSSGYNAKQFNALSEYLCVAPNNNMFNSFIVTKGTKLKVDDPFFRGLRDVNELKAIYLIDRNN